MNTKVLPKHTERTKTICLFGHFVASVGDALNWDTDFRPKRFGKAGNKVEAEINK